MHITYADRKMGRAEVELLHPAASEILADTYGLMIYQESMMRIAQQFAGYTLEEADNLRKACGKKIRQKMAEEKEKFIDGCETTGYGRRVGEQWWNQIEPFADYAFNKSHSYAYGLLAYQTAFLKANYPVEYMAALLTSVRDKMERLTPYLLDCRLQGIDVVVPDVNESFADFTPVLDPVTRPTGDASSSGSPLCATSGPPTPPTSSRRAPRPARSRTSTSSATGWTRRC